jgi:oligopeptide transport system permease protein
LTEEVTEDERQPKRLSKKNPLSMQLDLSRFEPATEEEKTAARGDAAFLHVFSRRHAKALEKSPCRRQPDRAAGDHPHHHRRAHDRTVQLHRHGHHRRVRDKTARTISPFTYSSGELEVIARGEKVFPHIFGTDALCRDYFMRVIYGTRVSLSVGLFASIIVLIIGLLYGSSPVRRRADGPHHDADCRHHLLAAGHAHHYSALGGA